jgi:hypothetical protein
MPLFVNPCVPNLQDYAAFLLNGKPRIPAVNLPADFVGQGTLVQGSALLTINSVTSGALYAGAALYDAAGAIPSGYTIIAGPLPFSGTTGTGAVGTYQMSGTALSTQGTSETISAYNSQIVMTYQIARDLVNTDIACASPGQYVLAIYNLAADRLFNFAMDIPNQTYFSDLQGPGSPGKPGFNLDSFTPGVLSAAYDNGTGTNVLNPEQMKLFTLQDLQTLKTPYGRIYMSIAQKYGVTIWGLS